MMTLHFVANKKSSLSFSGGSYVQHALRRYLAPTESATLVSLRQAGVEKLPACCFAWVLCCVGERSYRPLCCGGGMKVICVGYSLQDRIQANHCWAHY